MASLEIYTDKPKSVTNEPYQKSNRHISSSRLNSSLTQDRLNVELQKYIYLP